jgi:hypothetical protein
MGGVWGEREFLRFFDIFLPFFSSQGELIEDRVHQLPNFLEALSFIIEELDEVSDALLCSLIFIRETEDLIPKCYIRQCDKNYCNSK